MKLKYIGESFGVDSLTNGKIYDAEIENDDFYITLNKKVKKKHRPVAYSALCLKGLPMFLLILYHKENK